MEAARPSHRQAWILYLGYFAVTAACFYRPQLFFYFDDYFEAAHQGSTSSVLRFLLSGHNEHFIPLAKAVYAAEVLAFRERYGLYVLANCAMMAGVSLVWKVLLQRLGSPEPLSIAVPLIACTSLSARVNVTWAWQGCLILSAGFLILAVWAYFETRLFRCVLCTAAAALTFSSAVPASLALGVFLCRDYRIKRDRRLLIGGASLLGLFTLLVACQRIAAGAGAPSLQQAFWSQPTASANLASLARMGYYTVSLALAGPFIDLFWGSAPDHVPLAGTVLGGGGIAVLVAIAWRTGVLGIVGRLLLLQIALFTFIGPFRPAGGLAPRYYTSGLFPVLTAFAAAAAGLSWKIGCRPVWLIVPFVGVLGLDVGRVALQWDDRIEVERGRASRIDYFQTKAWLARHKGEVLPNQSGCPWISPFFSTEMMIAAMRVLDPGFAYPAPALRPVRYLENVEGNRLWALAPRSRVIEQSFRFGKAGVLTKVEVRTGQLKTRAAGVEISWNDEATTQWSAVIPRGMWPRGIWLAVPVDMVRLAPDHTYTLRVQLRPEEAGAELSLMMNRDPASYPDGGTRTPDGAAGDLCFRLAIMDAN